MQRKANYTQYGLSRVIGTQLRTFIESQLLDDLKYYPINEPLSELKFDWSDSCIEGHTTNYLNGRFENYSNIYLYNKYDKLVIDGWMDFIHKDDFIIVFWDFLDIYKNGNCIYKKLESGILSHIRIKLPPKFKNMSDNELLR